MIRIMGRNAQSFIVATWETPAKPGAIQFVTLEGKVCGITHACPCGCGKGSFIRLNPEVWPPDTKPMWTRGGDDLHMTLAPSIGIHHQGADQGKPGYHWHGFLRNGVFEEC
jgi:hypothetical protein